MDTRPDFDAQVVKQRLVDARVRAGLTQRQAAAALEIGQNSISRWESESFDTLPLLETLVRLAVLYRVSLDWLVGWVEHESGLPVGRHVVDKEMLRRIRRCKSRADWDSLFGKFGGEVVFLMPSVPEVTSDRRADRVKHYIRAKQRRMRES